LFATVRTGEPVPDAVTALWKDEGCSSLELQPLSRSETDALLALALGGAVDGRTERSLWEASRGAPLFLRELVLDGLERGSLSESDGLWSWHGKLGQGRRLRELVAARIGTLDEAEQSVLDAVALGEPVAASWLDETAAADELVRRGVLEARLDRRRAVLRFTHPLYGEVVRAGIPPRRSRAPFRRLADALESSGTRRRGDGLRLATWRVESGDDVPVELLLSAARSAELAFAPALAWRFARAAEQAGGGFEARFATARAVAAQGRPAEAESALAELATEATNDVERAMVAESRARLLAGGLARAEGAATGVEAARAGGARPGGPAQV